MNDIKYGRKRNGIIKELRSVVREWLDTIEDESVRMRARRDTIITGGSIASMLMGDPVNDFDVYFRTKETAIAVAAYYVDIANRKHLRSDENSVIGEVVTDFVENANDESEERVLIEFVRAGDERGIEFQQDIADDIYFFCESDEKFTISYISPNAITLTNKLQIIIRFYGEPEQIHNNYDFAHAMCSYDYKENILDLKVEALECMMSRTLVYRGSLYPIASIFRVKKFLERGWRISAGEQFKIMWQISKLDLLNQHVLREQLTGVDMEYLHALIYVLTNEETYKDGTIDNEFVMKIIEKSFESLDDDESEIADV